MHECDHVRLTPSLTPVCVRQMSAKQAALFAEEIAAEGGAGGDGTGAEAGEEDDAGADQGEAESPYGKPQQ